MERVLGVEVLCMHFWMRVGGGHVHGSKATVQGGLTMGSPGMTPGLPMRQPSHSYNLSPLSL